MGAFKNSEQLMRVARLSALAGVCLALTNCTVSDKLARKVDPKYGVTSSPRVVQWGEEVPKGGGTYRVGKPYMIAGQTYVPEEDQGYTAEGLASWYGDDFHGRRTANGEVFDMDGLSAAHPTLPMPSYVRVTNLNNRRSLIVRVNDRGPYHGNRVIDLSRKAAHMLGFHGNGVAKVRVEFVGRASLEGSDDRLLSATLREGEPAPIPSAVRVASARSFVPHTGLASPVVRGAVPMPQGRPYDLGESDSVTPAISASPAVARMPYHEPEQEMALGPRSLDDRARALQGPRLPSSAAAYAPARRNDRQSGSGLY